MAVVGGGAGEQEAAAGLARAPPAEPLGSDIAVREGEGPLLGVVAFPGSEPRLPGRVEMVPGFLRQREVWPPLNKTGISPYGSAIERCSKS